MAGGMLKVYRGPATEELKKALPPDPAKSLGGPGVGAIGQDVGPSKVGAPHRKGVKTLGKQGLKPKVQSKSKLGLPKQSSSKGY